MPTHVDGSTGCENCAKWRATSIQQAKDYAEARRDLLDVKARLSVALSSTGLQFGDGLRMGFIVSGLLVALAAFVWWMV